MYVTFCTLSCYHLILVIVKIIVDDSIIISVISIVMHGMIEYHCGIILYLFITGYTNSLFADSISLIHLRHKRIYIWNVLQLALQLVLL